MDLNLVRARKMSRLLGKLRGKRKEISLASTPADFLVAITNNLSGAVIVVDSRQEIFHYNAAALDLLNTNIDLIGRGISDVLTLRSKNGKSFNVRSRIERTLTSTVHDDLRLVEIEGEESVRLEMVISPIRAKFSKGSNPISGHVLFLRDITRAKSLEEERDEFISVVSHELRTPTATAEGAISNLQLMVKRPGAINKKVFAEALDSAHGQIRSLSGIVNSLSALSHAEREAEIGFEPVNVREVLERLFAELAPYMERKAITFDFDAKLSDVVVETYRPYLEEIVRNFLTNALKYTERGRVILRAFDTDEGVTIAVEDTGIGIGRADQKRIFDKFCRVESYRTRKTDGVGLGLYISAKLAKRLGATLDLESKLGAGATFIIILPRSIAPREE